VKIKKNTDSRQKEQKKGGHEERDISIRPSSWHKKLLSNFSKDVDSNSSVLSKEK
jgi:hypothetical protein